MKLFGEYLVEKQIVSEEALLNALITQMATIPSVCEIVFQKQLLSPSQILKALSYQTIHQTDFTKACVELGFWIPSVQEKIKLELQAIRVPIGQILVKQGTLSFQTITRALDEYLAEVGSATGPAVGSSSSADATVIQNYSNLLDASKVAAIEGLFDALPTAVCDTNREHALSDILAQIFKGIHEVKGMARFIKAPVTEKLTSQLEGVLTAASRSTKDMQLAEVDMLASIGKESLKMILAIKKTLLESGSESAFWCESQDRFEALCRDLSSLESFFSSKTTKEGKEAA